MNPDNYLDSPENIHLVTRLLELGKSLCGLELGPYLTSLVSAVTELIVCEAASILEVDDDGDQLHFLAAPQIHWEVLKSVKVPVRASIVGWVFQNDQPAVIQNVKEDPRYFKGIDKAINFTTHSMSVVPIAFHGEKIGALAAVNKMGESQFTENDSVILETVASYAAISIMDSHLKTDAQESQTILSQLNRMKSDFIAITSHELRTPLGLILGHATFLRDIIPDNYRSQLDIIIRNAVRLKNIIDNITRMDNAQTGLTSLQIRQISMQTLIEGVMIPFHDEAQQKNISMHFDIGPGDFLVEGDESKISIAFSNLLRNAIKFTNPGGHVAIVLAQLPDYVTVSVIDDGIGIPSKDLPHVFERFYQVESHLTREHAGMGLGLSVAKVMIEMHGGRIWAESTEGKGSNFTFLLPLKSGQISSVNQPPSS